MSLPCEYNPAIARKFPNPDFPDDICRSTRFAKLLFLTSQECDFGRRILASVFFGGVIGWERCQADRPAGIRTMSLVSMGACIFTICSIFAFTSSPMTWDSSRVSAAIPSGVGFLGAGMIWKQSKSNENNSDVTQTVHGLTTAASLWLSAAVGVSCGGQLYFAAAFCVSIMVLLLRFGPRNDDESSEADLYRGREEIGAFAQGDLGSWKDAELSPDKHRKTYQQEEGNPLVMELTHPQLPPASSSSERTHLMKGRNLSNAQKVLEGPRLV